MAIVIGTKTFSNPTPAATSTTISHTQTTGSNRGLLLSFGSSNSTTVTGVTYNGVAMAIIPLATVFVSEIGQYISTWYLANPSEGNHNLIITYSASIFSPVSIAIYSLTGCNGIGDSDRITDPDGVNYLTDPTSMTLTCSNNSLIFARGVASQSAGNPSVTVDGTSYNAVDMDVQHNTNQQTWCELAVNTVASGSRVVIIDASSGPCTGIAVELLASAVTARRIWVVG